MKHDLKAYRENYPTHCWRCGERLGGIPEEEELAKQVEEHDKLFPGEPLDTSCVICDRCFNTYAPGGKKISMN